MTAQILPLPVKKKPKVDTGPEYYCMACERDRFKLYQNGVVMCASCGVLIRNLKVEPTGDAA